MRRILLGLALMFASTLTAQTCAANEAVFSSVHIHALASNDLVSGNAELWPTDQNDNELNFADSRGLVTFTHKAFKVTSGAIDAFCVPRSDLTPVWIYYHFIVKNPTGTRIVDIRKISITVTPFTFAGFGFGSTPPGGSTVNAVDAVARALAAAACQSNGTNCPSLSGPQGPAGPAGAQGPAGPAGTGTTNTASPPLSISGSNIALTGIVPLANGGTGAADATGARANLGLASMALQPANSVAITGGTASLASMTIVPSGSLPNAWTVQAYVDSVNSVPVGTTLTFGTPSSLPNLRVTVLGNLSYVFPSIGIDGTGINFSATTRSGAPVALEQVHVNPANGQPSGKWIQQYYSTTTGGAYGQVDGLNGYVGGDNLVHYDLSGGSLNGALTGTFSGASTGTFSGAGSGTFAGASSGTFSGSGSGTFSGNLFLNTGTSIGPQANTGFVDYLAAGQQVRLWSSGSASVNGIVSLVTSNASGSSLSVASLSSAKFDSSVPYSINGKLGLNGCFTFDQNYVGRLVFTGGILTAIYTDGSPC